jgi:hypothetical protein
MKQEEETDAQARQAVEDEPSKKIKMGKIGRKKKGGEAVENAEPHTKALKGGESAAPAKTYGGFN